MRAFSTGLVAKKGMKFGALECGKGFASFGLRLAQAERFLVVQPNAIRQFSSQLRVLSEKHSDSVNKGRISDQLSSKIINSVTKSKQLKAKITEPIKKFIPEHENIYTIPNILTATRLLTAPLIGYFIVQDQVYYALALFTYSCITDFVDGFIARRFHMSTVVGSVIDPMADKILMIVCTTCLAQAGTIPIYLATIILGRDVLLGISAVYYRYISLPKPKTLIRFFDFSIPSAEVHPTLISKYNTMFQMLYIGTAVLKPVLLTQIDPSLIELLETSFSGFGYFVGLTTILSGLSYVFSKNAVKILTPPKK